VLLAHAGRQLAPGSLEEGAETERAGAADAEEVVALGVSAAVEGLGAEHLEQPVVDQHAAPVAAAAGAVTFLSPCCLPLVPGYLSDVTGMSGTAIVEPGAAESATAAEPVGATEPAGATATLTRAQPATVRARSRVVLGTLLFILGFSVLFAIEGITVSSIGDTLAAHAEGISRILGAVIIVLGLVFMGPSTSSASPAGSSGPHSGPGRAWPARPCWA